MFKLMRWHPNERVDLSDQEAGTGDLVLADQLVSNRLIELPAGRNVGVANTETRIFSGFDISNIVGLVCRINRGTGLFKLLVDGDPTLALLIGEAGDAYKVVDLTALPDADYAIYVRATYIDSTAENRVHWDATGSTEVVLNVLTRQDLTWEYIYQSFTAAPPSGGDWVLVAKINKAAGVLLYYDYRHFYFEGDACLGAGQWANEWGTALERNVDRATYGIHDWHKFASMVRRKFADIHGAGSAWYTAPTLDLTKLLVQHDTAGEHLNITAISIQLDAPPGNQYLLETFADGTKRCLGFTCTENPNSGAAVLEINDVEDSAELCLNPRGFGKALSVADFGSIVVLGPDNVGGEHGFRATKLAAADYGYGLGRLVGAGSPTITIREGAGAAVDGLTLNGTGAKFRHAAVTAPIWLELDKGTRNDDGGSNWFFSYPSPLVHPNFCWAINSGHAGDRLVFTTKDWPCGMTLNSVDFLCEFTGAGPAVVALAATVERHTWTGGVAYPSRTTLATGTKNAIALALLNVPTPVNNTMFDPRYDMIALVLSAPDTGITGCLLYGIALNVTFTLTDKYQPA